MGAMQPMSHRISHSSHVRGDHYFCALCFLGSWLTTLICRDMRNLKLSCCCDLDIGAGCKLSDEQFFYWKMLTWCSWDFHRSVFFHWSCGCVIFRMELLEENKRGRKERGGSSSLWNDQSTWETVKWEVQSPLWVNPSKTSQINAVISQADGY